MKSFARVLVSVAAAVVCAMGWPLAAHAEVWAYVDADGVAHFAAQQQDERYQLFSRGGESLEGVAGSPEDDTSSTTSTPAAAGEASLKGLSTVMSMPTAAPRVMASLEASPRYRQVRQHLREASSRHGIDYELLKALIVTESGFNAAAVSPKGAVGLMQVMPATAERFGVAGDARMPVEAKLADPQTNIRTGARYLSYLLTLFPGRLELALAAYNAGEGAVQRAGNRIPNYRETQNYVKTVLQLYGLLKPAVVPAGVGRGAGNGSARVRVELPGVQPQAALQGGAMGRGNLPGSSRPAALAIPSIPSAPSAPSTPAARAAPSGPAGSSAFPQQ